MEFFDVVKDRYSCKKYNGIQIKEDVLNKILEAGRLAPTAKNLQEQHIYVVQSAEKLKLIDELTICRYNAPTVLVFTYDKNNVYTYPNGKKDSGAEDTAIVATHIMLAAADLNVDSCWINRINPDEVHEKLNLPENEEVVLFMDLGYKAEGAGPLPNHSDRKELSETVTFL